MKKLLLIPLLLLFVSACVSKEVQMAYDTRSYSEDDRNTILPYQKDFISMIAVGGTNVLTADPKNGPENAKTVQKFFCACWKKLNNRCKANSVGISAEDKELWAKGNAADLTLRSQGYNHYTDPILCD